MTPAGIEPAISGMKARRPRPLDDGAESCIKSDKLSDKFFLLWRSTSINNNPTATLDGITQNCPRRITILRSPATRETTFDVPINPWHRDVCSRSVAVGLTGLGHKAKGLPTPLPVPLGLPWREHSRGKPPELRRDGDGTKKRALLTSGAGRRHCRARRIDQRDDVGTRE